MAEYYNSSSSSEYSDLIINGSDGQGSYTWTEHVTIDAKDGNDTIENYSGDHISVNGGTGNDLIFPTRNYSSNENVTIKGGEGDDTIGYADPRYTSDKRYYTRYCPRFLQYSKGDGNDVVYGYSYNDTIQLLVGADVTAITKNGDDIILTMNEDEGNINLKYAANFASNYVNAPIRFANKKGNTSAILFNGYDTVAVDVRNFNTSSNSVEGTENNDVIELRGDDNYSSNVGISMGEGDDTLYFIILIATMLLFPMVWVMEMM